MTEEFVAGMIFSKIDYAMSNMYHYGKDTCNLEYKSKTAKPFLWEGIVNKTTEVERIVQIVVNEFESQYGEQYSIMIHRDFPYMKKNLELNIEIIPKVKEMTISEIEKELGYKIKIINNN